MTVKTAKPENIKISKKGSFKHNKKSFFIMLKNYFFHILIVSGFAVFKDIIMRYPGTKITRNS